MTIKQNNAARNAHTQFCEQCVKAGTDRNQHEGVAAFMIARALMSVTLGLKYYQAEQWALNYLTELTTKPTSRITKYDSLAEARKDLLKDQKLVVVEAPLN